MFTALDILAQSQRSEKDFDIVESLRSYGASRTIDQPLSMKMPIIQAAKASLKIPHDHVHQIRKNQEDNSKGTSNPEYYWLAKKRESLMIVASLIATMAFQAGISPPGGLWEDHGTSYDESISKNVTHVAGESIISYYPNMSDYHAYLISNTVGFVGSLSIILLLVTGLPFCRKFLMWILTIILWVTVTAMTITYLIAIAVAAPRHDFHSTPCHVITILLISWGIVMHVIVLLQAIHIFRKLFKWLRNLIIKRMSRRKQNNAKDVETTSM